MWRGAKRRAAKDIATTATVGVRMGRALGMQKRKESWCATTRVFTRWCGTNWRSIGTRSTLDTNGFEYETCGLVTWWVTATAVQEVSENTVQEVV
jgi:hypothetical protein